MAATKKNAKTPAKRKPLDLQVDVAIVGGGHAGLSLAAILGRAGVTVACIDRDNPKTTLKQSFDGRTTAISLGSKRVFDAAGIWPHLEADGEPIVDIRVADGHSPLFLHFDSRDVGHEPFGWIFENRLIRKALFECLDGLENVHHVAPATVVDFELDDHAMTVLLEDGGRISAPLCIGADGRGSFTRQWAGIDTRGHSYNQNAIVCTVGHENPHEGLAVENFMPSGPFATLPMTDAPDGTHRSSVVWTEHGGDDTLYLEMPEEDFNAELQERFGESFGKVHLIGGRFSYPLTLSHAKSYVAPRLALVADAAHGIHPIAGQGLNLGMRDIAVLAELIVDQKRLGLDIGAWSLLQRYRTLRRGDNIRMIAATDALNRLFSNDIAPVRILRDIGLGVVHHVPPMKRFFMRQAMGLSGNPPRLIRGQPLN